MSNANNTTPTFAEYESYFQEGFEDFGGWNPVSVDQVVEDAVANAIAQNDPSLLPVQLHPRQFRSLPDDFFRDGEEGDSPIPGLLSNDEDPYTQPLHFTPPLQLQIQEEPHQQQQQQQQQQQRQQTTRPTCYAPLFPIIHMPTYFKTLKTLEEAVEIIQGLLQEMEGMAFRFNASETGWYCSFLNGASHGTLIVKMYRYRTGNHHAVEMQKLDGDDWVFRSVYEKLDEKLRDRTIEEIIPEWPRPADYTEVEPVENVVEEEEPGLITAEQPDFVVPRLSDLKSVILANFRYGRLQAVLESTQIAYSIYSSEELGVPEDNDILILRELMTIVNDSETNSDWMSQHSVLTVRAMSLSPEYCEKIFSSGDLGETFVEAIFLLARPGTYTTQTMRRECVLLLNNLLKENKNYVYRILSEEEIGGEEKVLLWVNTPYVRDILRENAFNL